MLEHDIEALPKPISFIKVSYIVANCFRMPLTIRGGNEKTFLALTHSQMHFVAY